MNKSKLQIIIRQSIIPLGVKLIGIELVFTLVTVLISTIFATPVNDSGLTLGLAFMESPLIFLLSAGRLMIIIMLVLDWAGKKYIVRKDAITLQDGVINNRKKVIQSEHIETVELTQNIFQRMLNFGTIRIYSPMLNKMIYLRDVTKPKQVIQHINEVFRGNAKKKIMMPA